MISLLFRLLLLIVVVSLWLLFLGVIFISDARPPDHTHITSNVRFYI